MKVKIINDVNNADIAGHYTIDSIPEEWIVEFTNGVPVGSFKSKSEADIYASKHKGGKVKSLKDFLLS